MVLKLVFFGSIICNPVLEDFLKQYMTLQAFFWFIKYKLYKYHTFSLLFNYGLRKVLAESRHTTKSLVFIVIFSLGNNLCKSNIVKFLLQISESLLIILFSVNPSVRAYQIIIHNLYFLFLLKYFLKLGMWKTFF